MTEFTAGPRTFLSTYRYGEIILGIHALSWGAILLMPEDTLAFARRFELLYWTGLDWILGALLLISGACLLFGKSLKLRQHCHGFMFGLWCFVGYLGLVTGDSLISLLISLPYFYIALLHAGKWWRLSQERQL
jgi:hypothetical protein